MSAPGGRPRVLGVDDEPNVLSGWGRQLRERFDLVGVGSGREALAALAGQGPFAVVLTDNQMPGMSGIALLAEARRSAPDTVRVLLTGQADLAAATAAVNEGHVFRFLSKPCPPSVLIAALEAAVEQHRLICAERELLEQTLRGSVRALLETLALASPLAFGRATRVKRHVVELAAHLRLPDQWQIEVAAMLSQIGAVTLPPALLEKLCAAEPLAEAEQAMVERLPQLAEQLLANIPRIDGVRAIVRYQAKGFDGSGPPWDRVSGAALPIGARLLKVALDYDALEARGRNADEAAAELSRREGRYDPSVLAALVELHRDEAARLGTRDVSLAELRPGMVLAGDVRTRGDLLLVARGHEVTVGLLERIRNFSRAGGVVEPIRVLAPVGEVDVGLRAS